MQWYQYINSQSIKYQNISQRQMEPCLHKSSTLWTNMHRSVSLLPERFPGSEKIWKKLQKKEEII